MSPRTAALIGAPAQLGQPLAGTDKGPQLMRDAGLYKSLAALGWRVEEMGDVVSSFMGDWFTLFVDFSE